MNKEKYNLFSRFLSRSRELTQENQKEQLLPSIEHLRSHAFNKRGRKSIKQATKLHLGCGANIMDGWLNSDLVLTDSVPQELWERIPSIFIMDATETFPFPDNKFEFIYCEDFLEHFDQKDGLSIFAECFRVLKPNGVWRLSTPNFDWILSHLDFSTHESIDFGHWNWGHKLIYSEKYALSCLEAVGFSVRKCKYAESEHKVLKEIDSRADQKYLNLIMEATKPQS